jgi:hypothetical protein
LDGKLGRQSKEPSLGGNLLLHIIKVALGGILRWFPRELSLGKLGRQSKELSLGGYILWHIIKVSLGGILRWFPRELS